VISAVPLACVSFDSSIKVRVGGELALMGDELSEHPPMQNNKAIVRTKGWGILIISLLLEDVP
jgi:hypothetical protein